MSFGDYSLIAAIRNGFWAIATRAFSYDTLLAERGEACLEMTHVGMLLANNMKRCRKILDLSQAELAERVSCSTTLIGNIETLKRFPSARNLDRIAAALGIPPSDLFAEDSAAIKALQSKYEVREKFEKTMRQALNEALGSETDG
jgi:transcriptional regulator with XRE-family HTH domain